MQQATTTMKLEVTGKGVVLFGDTEGGKWFERWFATSGAAKNYALKHDWKIKEDGR